MILLLGVALALPLSVGWVDRPADALSGTAIARELPDEHFARQARLEEELLRGNLPAHLRDWVEVDWEGVDLDGNPHTVAVWVTRDYLAVGSERDFLRAALDGPTAMRVAEAVGAWLPTPLVVDEVWEHAGRRMTPRPLPPGPAMSTPRYSLWHRAVVGWSAPRELTAGHKKDVVLCRDLVWRPDKLAIYGWHRRNGEPIQPLSLWHGAAYADYSHGIRLVRDVVAIDGVERSAFEVLADPVLWPLLTDEGCFPEAKAVMDRAAGR